MPRFRIEIEADNFGLVEWELHGGHKAKDNNDADSAELINVIKRLNKFTKELEAYYQPKE